MNNNVVVNNIPSTNRKDFGHKAINHSSAHNENQQQMLDDILDLFNKTNSIERTINENIDYIKQETKQLESINLALLTKYKDLESQLNSIKNGDIDKKLLITPYDCSIYDKTFGAIIDKDSADITVRPSQKISKLSIFDNVSNSMFLPNTLNVNIRNYSKGVISETDNDIFAPFGADDLYWTRRIITDNTREFIETEYIITLPDEIMTSPEMNEIIISPFMCKVTAIHYRYGDSAMWELVPGQNYNKAIISSPNSLEEYLNSSRCFKLNFPNKKANQVKITLRCNNYMESETNLRTFIFGLKDVGIFLNYYNSYESSTFQFQTTIKESKPIMINGIDTFFNNGSQYCAYSRDLLFDIFYKDSAGHYHKILDEFPFTPPTNDIRVRCSFGENSPDVNIERLELKYIMM